MTYQQLIMRLLFLKQGGNASLYPDVYDQTIEELLKLQKIKEITERALRSSDTINLYKSLCLKDISEILGIKTEAPDKTTEACKGQITFDEII